MATNDRADLIIHLIRNTFRLASKKDWDALRRDVKPIYTAPSPPAARAALDELAEKWGTKYGAIIGLWENAWEELIPYSWTGWDIRPSSCRLCETALPIWSAGAWRSSTTRQSRAPTRDQATHRTAPHRTAPHRTAPHRTAPNADR